MVELLLVFHWCSLENGNSVCALVLKTVARVSFNSNVQSFLKLKKIHDNPRSYFRKVIITFPREKKNEIKPGVFYLHGLEVIIISQLITPTDKKISDMKIGSQPRIRETFREKTLIFL